MSKDFRVCVFGLSYANRKGGLDETIDTDSLASAERIARAMVSASWNPFAFAEIQHLRIPRYRVTQGKTKGKTAMLSLSTYR